MVIKSIPYIEPFKIFEALSLKEIEVPLFLDSALIDDKTGKYSIICIGIKEKITVKNTLSNGFEILKNFYEKHRNKYKRVPFYGIYGYITYDSVKYIEKLPDTAIDDIKMPDISFFLPETVLIFDNRKGLPYRK